MIHKPIKFITLVLLVGALAILFVEVTFHCLNAPVERDIVGIQKEMTKEARIAVVEQAARLAEQMEHVRPTIEYGGHLFIEGMIIEGGDITHYCRCAKCCKKWVDVHPRKTADGTLLDEIDRTGEKVASCNWIPFDSIIKVDSTEYRIADRGGKGLDIVGRLDIYVPEGHQAALDAGRPQGVEIKIIKLGEVK